MTVVVCSCKQTLLPFMEPTRGGVAASIVPTKQIRLYEFISSQKPHQGTSRNDFLNSEEEYELEIALVGVIN